MGIMQGLTSQITYNGATDKLKVGQLLAAIPDPDVAPSQQGIRGWLDEMPPMAAAQLRVELTALIAAVT